MSVTFIARTASPSFGRMVDRPLTHAVPAALHRHRKTIQQCSPGLLGFEVWKCLTDRPPAFRITKGKRVVEVRWFGEVEGTCGGVISISGVEQVDHICGLAIEQESVKKREASWNRL
jgi:hypothetical protein